MVLGELKFTFSGDSTENETAMPGYNADTCKTATMPQGAKLVGVKGYWAETSCCPLASGFKMKFDNGEIVSVGLTPNNAEELTENNPNFWVDMFGADAQPHDFKYSATDWTEETRPIIGYTGQAGAAFDEVQLIVNDCGVDKLIEDAKQNLEEETVANKGLADGVNQMKAIVE